MFSYSLGYDHKLRCDGYNDLEKTFTYSSGYDDKFIGHEHDDPAKVFTYFSVHGCFVLYYRF